MNLTPSYGRDYKSKAAIETDLLAGKDFTIADISAGADNGRYVNFEQLQQVGISSVTVRYKQLRSVTVIDLKALVKKAAKAKAAGVETI